MPSCSFRVTRSTATAQFRRLHASATNVNFTDINVSEQDRKQPRVTTKQRMPGVITLRIFFPVHRIRTAKLVQQQFRRACRHHFESIFFLPAVQCLAALRLVLLSFKQHRDYTASVAFDMGKTTDGNRRVAQCGKPSMRNDLFARKYGAQGVETHWLYKHTCYTRG